MSRRKVGPAHWLDEGPCGPGIRRASFVGGSLVTERYEKPVDQSPPTDDTPRLRWYGEGSPAHKVWARMERCGHESPRLGASGKCARIKGHRDNHSSAESMERRREERRTRWHPA